MPLGIIELLTRIGEDHIRVQNVVESATNFTARKGGETAITFLTREINPTMVFANAIPKFGLVIWLPADRVAQAQRDHHAPERAGGGA